MIGQEIYPLEFLPVSCEDMRGRDLYYYDFLIITGDAYIDHPSFGAAVIGRVLEADGHRVAILAQPDWHDTAAVESMGRPRYAAMITAGNLDSMVAHYTAAKKPRREDYYSPGKKAGLRPDRACIVYANLVRAAFPGLPVIIGGLEASLRRFAHYDYWDNEVRRPILFDTKADILIYGMGETAVREVAARLKSGDDVKTITDVRGTGYIVSADEMSAELSACGTPLVEKCPRSGNVPAVPLNYVTCPPFEAVRSNKRAYAKAVMMQYDEHDPVRGNAVIQKCDGRTMVINPPSAVLSSRELDRIYELPYSREVHPMYKDAGGVPAIEEVRFSITHTRGCFGACNFCALAFHQGRIVSSRSRGSVIREAEALTQLPDFKGYINDVGGPTANFRHPSCSRQLKHGVCKLSACGSSKGHGNTQSSIKTCLVPEPCRNLDTSHSDYLALLRSIAALPGVKKVFVRSGIRFDYLMLDKSGEFFAELVKNHISGQLKVAPEHCADDVLGYMGKPKNICYTQFKEKYKRLNMRYGKQQFLVPYLMSSHPGSTLAHAAALAEELNKSGSQPEQVQDFYPTPGTLSTCMFYTALDPRDMSPVYVPRTQHEKALQRALLQWKNPKNRNLCREALKLAGREDLIGYGKRCLIPPAKKRLLYDELGKS